MNFRLGRWSQKLAPGYGSCERCKTPWRFVESHTTDYTKPSIDPPRAGFGMFALCSKCWAELTPTDRLPFYMAVWHRWERTRAIYPDADPVDWTVLRDAVLAGE